MSSEREQKQLEDASQALAGRFQDIKTSLRDMKQITENTITNTLLDLGLGQCWASAIKSSLYFREMILCEFLRSADFLNTSLNVTGHKFSNLNETFTFSRKSKL